MFSLIHSSFLSFNASVSLSQSLSPSSVMHLILVAVFVRSVYRLDAHTNSHTLMLKFLLSSPLCLFRAPVVSLMYTVCSLLMSDNETMRIPHSNLKIKGVFAELLLFLCGFFRRSSYLQDAHWSSFFFCWSQDLLDWPDDDDYLSFSVEIKIRYPNNLDQSQ